MQIHVYITCFFVIFMLTYNRFYTLGGVFVKLKRKIYDDLIRWKENSRGATALMIDGARRVGKSYIA